jgi:holo-[acyl-carrier protein] synthase
MRGIGNDIIEIERIESTHKEHGEAFLKRLFTEKEKAYCFACQNPYPRLAGRFAAKEAIAKALGTGFSSELSWHDIEILPDERGKPVPHLFGTLRDLYPNLKLYVSISHAKTYAAAVAVAL